MANTYMEGAQHHSLLEKCNQNHNRASPHTNQNGHHQKKKNKKLKTINAGEHVKKREPDCSAGI